VCRPARSGRRGSLSRAFFFLHTFFFLFFLDTSPWARFPPLPQIPFRFWLFFPRGGHLSPKIVPSWGIRKNTARPPLPPFPSSGPPPVNRYFPREFSTVEPFLSPLNVFFGRIPLCNPLFWPPSFRTQRIFSPREVCPFFSPCSHHPSPSFPFWSFLEGIFQSPLPLFRSIWVPFPHPHSNPFLKQRLLFFPKTERFFPINSPSRPSPSVNHLFPSSLRSFFLLKQISPFYSIFLSSQVALVPPRRPPCTDPPSPPPPLKASAPLFFLKELFFFFSCAMIFFLPAPCLRFFFFFFFFPPPL